MEKLLTVKDVQAALGVGRDWVYLRINSGELKSQKLGRYRRFKKKDVEALLLNNETSTKKSSN